MYPTYLRVRGTSLLVRVDLYFYLTAYTTLFANGFPLLWRHLL